MENNNKHNLSEEHIRKIKYRVGYNINESPKYRPIDMVSDEFDEIPSLTNEAGEQEDSPQFQEKEDPREPSNMQSVEGKPPVPEFDRSPDDVSDEPPIGDEMGSEIDDEPSYQENNPSQEVDEIQNEIIRHNIEAMKGIHGELESLSSLVQSLNNKFTELETDVDEVREPTNVEKMMDKKSVSYPYYFNLNDFWSGNWFDNKNNNQKERGIRELPNGTFIADFDDLPEKSSIEIQDSFNDY